MQPPVAWPSPWLPPAPGVTTFCADFQDSGCGPGRPLPAGPRRRPQHPLCAAGALCGNLWCPAPPLCLLGPPACASVCWPGLVSPGPRAAPRQGCVPAVQGLGAACSVQLPAGGRPVSPALCHSLAVWNCGCQGPVLPGLNVGFTVACWGSPDTCRGDAWPCVPSRVLVRSLQLPWGCVGPPPPASLPSSTGGCGAWATPARLPHVFLWPSGSGSAAEPSAKASPARRRALAWPSPAHQPCRPWSVRAWQPRGWGCS